MQSALEKKRVVGHKRSRESISQSTTTSTKSNHADDDKCNNKNSPPIICLTGFSTREKDELDLWIKSLGGIHTRNLDTAKNTHLVAKETTGPKYQVAQSTPTIRIVNAFWLQQCFQAKQWLPVRPGDHDFDRVLPPPPSPDENKPSTRLAPKPLTDVLEPLLATESIDSDQTTIFSPCHFVLLGFDETTLEYRMLGKLIRRGLGRISWSFNDTITHVVIPDATCDETVRDAAKLFQNEHPNSPDIVSPRWIASCWQEKQLVDVIDFGPIYLPREEMEVFKKPTKAKSKSISTKSNLFHNCVFAFLRVKPPSWAVDYNTKDLEDMIQANGGQILSPRIVEALLIDHAGASSSHATTKRKGYVICWGGNVESNLAMHSTMIQVKHVVDWNNVTPNWLHTCCSEAKVVSRRKCPDLFHPSPWPIQKLSPKIRIAVSGLSGSLRTAAIHAITTMGAMYDDSMRTHTTHLICQTASGLKYNKAVEWNLFIVSLDWLFHVAEHGYKGKKALETDQEAQSAKGCEANFPVSS